MTLTNNTMEWLNQNRRRSYPFVRDEWRELPATSANMSLDCLVLDALVFDSDSEGEESLVLESVEVSQSDASFSFRYGDSAFFFRISGGEESGEGSFTSIQGAVGGAYLSFTLSSHAYIHENVGEGKWTIGCRVLPTRVIRLTDGSGIKSVKTNGSYNVSGHENAVDVSGNVVLENGYRTSPIIYDGEILVRVGKRYGYDPCHYDYGGSERKDCRKPLLFFCGQNAVNSGNVILKGGRGISVTQGGTYTIDDPTSKCNGMTIPCIEIVAGRELQDIGTVET